MQLVARQTLDLLVLVRVQAGQPSLFISLREWAKGTGGGLYIDLDLTVDKKVLII